MPEVEFRNFTRTPLPEAGLRGYAARVMALIPGAAEESVEIVFTGKTRIRRLNAQYRRKNAPTDVLSFNVRTAGDGGPGPFGSIVICVPVAAENAKKSGATLTEMLEELILHSLLHLTGGDHETKAAHRAMENRRRRIAAKLKG